MIKSTYKSREMDIWGTMYKSLLTILLLSLMSTSLYASVWNNPHDSKKVATDTLFAAFTLPPKRLDPVISYNANEWAIKQPEALKTWLRVTTMVVRPGSGLPILS